MFEISLRKCNAEMNRVDKSSAMSDLLSIYGTLKEGCSLYEPSIRVKLSPDKMFGYNYAYIEAFNRYYFITEISTDTNGYVVLDMVTDVLMTYKEQFKSCPAFVLRNQYRYNSYLVDKRLPLTNKIQVTTQRGIKMWGNSDAAGSNGGIRVAIVLASNAASSVGGDAVGGIKVGSSFYEPRGDKETDVTFMSNFRQPHNNGMNIILVNAATLSRMLQFLASRDKGVNLFNGTVLSIYSIPVMSIDATNDEEYYASVGFRKLNPHDAIIYLKTPTEQEAYEFEDNDTAYVLDGSNYKPDVKCEFTVPLNDFLDLPPYKSYTLLLPFVGAVRINESWFSSNKVNQTVSIRVAIDWTLCEVAYYISVNDIYCTTASGRFGSLIPFTTTNLADISAQQLAATTKKEGADVSTIVGGIIGTVGAAAMTFVNPALGAAALAGTAATMATSWITSSAQYSSTLEAMVPRSQSSPADSEYLNCNTPCYISLIIQSTPKPEMTDFRALNGSPLLEHSTIGDMKGYTEFGTIHLDGVTALKPELEELDRRLHEGVIL